MNTEMDKKSTPKLTGRRYRTVSDLMKDESISQEVQQKVAQIEEETRLVHQLSLLRQLAGLTQEELATQLKITQSAVSKIESGRDEDLTIGQIKEYAQATGQRIGVVFGKPLNHVECVKAHALGIRKSLSALATMAHKDDDMEKAIQGFFGEAFFNILDILSKCQSQMPNGKNIEVRMEIIGSAQCKQHKLNSDETRLVNA